MGKYEQLAKELVPELVPYFLKYGSGYEEGTFTPSFSGTSISGVFTYSAQAGFYTRIGNQVIIHARLSISAIGTNPTGLMELRNLPFALANTTNLRCGVYFTLISNFNYTANALDLGGYIIPGEDKIHLTESFDNAAQVDVPAANFTNANCALWFSGIYQVG